MSDTAPVVLGGGELRSDQLLLGADVPETEVHLQPSVAGHRGQAVHQRLGAGILPGVELGFDPDVEVLLREGRRVQRPEQPRALQVRRDHLRDVAADAGAEIRNGDRQRLHSAFVDVDFGLSGRRQRSDNGEHCHAYRQ